MFSFFWNRLFSFMFKVKDGITFNVLTIPPLNSLTKGWCTVFVPLVTERAHGFTRDVF